MPKPPNLEHLYDTARDLREHLLPRVLALIPMPTTIAQADRVGAGGVFGSKVPWNWPAVHLADDVTRLSRVCEQALQRLCGFKVTKRGMSHRNTAKALERIPVLVDHAVAKGHGEHPDVLEAARLVGVAWPKACRAILDEPLDHERRWTRAPGDLSCPHCGNWLWLAPGWSDGLAPDELRRDDCRGDVWCRECRDDSGKRLRWAPSAWLGLVMDEAIEAVDAATRLVTAGEAAAIIPGLQADTVSKWVRRRKLEPAGMNSAGHRLFRLGDLRHAQANDRRRTRTRKPGLVLSAPVGDE